MIEHKALSEDQKCYNASNIEDLAIGYNIISTFACSVLWRQPTVFSARTIGFYSLSFLRMVRCMKHARYLRLKLLFLPQHTERCR